MELAYFISNINNPAQLIPQMQAEWKGFYELKAFREYNPKFHKIRDKALRPDKIVRVNTGLQDEQGNELTTPKVVNVARIPIPIQRLIVSRSAAFTTGGGVTLKADATTDAQRSLFTIVANTWKNNKMDFRNNEIAKAFMSETEVAEIWYSKVNQDKSVEMKCGIYKPSDGYTLVPVFDPYKDLIAFGLGFVSKSILADGRKVSTQHMDVYSADQLIKYVRIDGEQWKIATATADLPNPLPLVYGKIPVIYYSTQESAWQIVQDLIERYETLISNFADTNDYNGSPILFSKGHIKGMSSKGEAGKLIESVGEGADLKYVTWEGAPESIKLEIETLRNLIFTCTQTPNISFEEMKSVGDISGVAFDRIMIDAHLKAKDYQSGIYGEGVQRRLNFLISACAEITPGTPIAAKDLEIRPIFNLFRLNDDAARIQNALLANGNKPVMGLKESVAYAGVSDDVEETYNVLEVENKAALDEAAGLGTPDANPATPPTDPVPPTS